MSDQIKKRAEQLQGDYARRGDATGWFDDVYSEAGRDTARIPWSERGLNPELRAWAERTSLNGASQTAVVIGCGLGDNAEFLAARGFAVTAFDISATAVAWCRERHQGSAVRYEEGDLFNAAATFGTFDFVLEVHTLQALPRSLRSQAIDAVAALVRQRLLVICRGCDQPEPDEIVPWPLTREELARFETSGLTVHSFEDYWDHKEPPVRRFRAEYRRAYTKS